MRTKPSPAAKLTPEQVLEIRRLEGEGNTTYKEIAARFGVNTSLVCQIVKRDVWRWLKAARAAALLIVLAAAAGGAEVYEYPTTPDRQPNIQEILDTCKMTVEFFLDHRIHPKPDCDYQLWGVVVFQKVEGGYLLSSDFELNGTTHGLVFLRTKAPLEKGTRFNGEMVHPAGEYEYDGIDGFKKTVWAFNVVVPAGAKEVTE